MTSTVTNYSTKIDTNFPPAGQALTGVIGFINNFKNINNSFETIIDEVDRLEKNLVQLQKNNNFGGKILQNAVFTNTSFAINEIGLLESGVIDLDYSQGHYQTCLVNNGYFLFNITNWSMVNAYSSLRLEVKNNASSTATTCKIYFSGNVTYIGSSDTTFTLPGDSPVFFDIWSIDNGDNIFVRPLGIPMGVISTGTSGIGGSVGPAPVITYINPLGAGSSGGYLMSLVGSNFGATPIVVVNGNQRPAIYSSSTSEIVFYSLPGFGGEYHTVYVSTANGNSNEIAYFLYEDATGE